MRRAVAFWGNTPCGGSVAVVAGAPSEAPAAGTNVPGARRKAAAMWATWRVPASGAGSAPGSYAAAAATFTECVVHINVGVWPGWRAEDARFGAFCKEMLHEYGHFEGYPDTGATPGTIQYERPDLARVPLCERYRLIYGHTLYSSPPPARHRLTLRHGLRHQM